ncbi:MAG TPA: hypothetical protein VNI77_01490 [Nitrososphaera sp.]|nr:hypothetical protein [Nitrososphaera sp.]
MRTDEEAKYNLDEQIFELYDRGMSVDNICDTLLTTLDYVKSVLSNVRVED